MNLYNVKPGANITNLKPVIKNRLNDFAQIFKDVAGENYIPTLTSGNDSTHMATSFHYKDLATDWRTRDLTPEQANEVIKRLKEKFDYIGFDLVNEPNAQFGQHIHIEYDPHTGDKLSTPKTGFFLFALIATTVFILTRNK